VSDCSLLGCSHNKPARQHHDDEKDKHDDDDKIRLQSLATIMPSLARILGIMLGLAVLISLIDDDLILAPFGSLNDQEQTSIAKPSSTNSTDFWNALSNFMLPNSSESTWGNIWNTTDGFLRPSFTDWGWAGEALKPPPDPNNQNLQRISIVIDWRPSEPESWPARLAFARMIQLEASRNHGLETKLVAVVGGSDQNIWSTCFPKLDMVVSTNVKDLKLKQLEQEQWLQDESVLLEAAPDIWYDGLLLLQRHSKQVRSHGTITVPFLRVDSPPTLREWKYLPDLRDTLAIHPDCCAIPKLPGNHSVVYFKESPLPDSLYPSTQVVLVSHNPANNILVPPSLPSLYCLLAHDAGEQLVATQTSLTLWAALANTASQTIQLVGHDSNNHDATSYDAKDIRSRIQIIQFTPTTNTTLETIQVDKEPPHNTNPLLLLGTPEKPLTLVILLSGEMGNQLSKIAHGYGMKWILEEDYNITTRIVLQHQPNLKWVRARWSVVTCFPQTSSWDFAEGNTEEFNVRHSQQRKWLGDDVTEILTVKDCNFESCLRQAFETLVNVINNSSRPAIPDNANITLPFLQSNTYGNVGYINDRFYERLLDLFQYDQLKPDCCKERAMPNDVVLHIRGFLVEMPRQGKKWGFEELSPNKTVHELLGHLKPNDTVAIVSRFPTKLDGYVEAMRDAGLKVRVLNSLSGEQSFCFLLSAEREIAGYSMSTFATWAAYLTNATRSRLYYLISPERSARGFVTDYNFVNPILKKKLSLHVYNSEDQDRLDRNKLKTLNRTG
jgi:hypothetical protein